MVVNAFNVKYPSAKKVQWVKEGAEFEVEFELQETDFSATFDSSGKWIETESSIAFDKMPAAVRNTLQYSFAGYKIKETEKVDSEKWGSGFEVLLKKKHDRRILVLNEKGEVINNEPEI